MNNIIIVGAGHAGCQAAFSLREEGFKGNIFLFNGENILPYQRPPLTKNFLTNKGLIDIEIKSKDLYDDNRINLIYETVVFINRNEKFVSTDKNNKFFYDHLILATGTLTKKADFCSINSVFEMKTINDAKKIINIAQKHNKIVIIGGGFIGLELTSFFIKENKEITIINKSNNILDRSVSYYTSNYLNDYYVNNNVTILNNINKVDVKKISDNNFSISIDNNLIINCNVLISCIGVYPNTNLASISNIEVNNGITTNEYLLTSDENISAIGDCANFPLDRFQKNIRLECIQNATDQARYVAKRILGDNRKYFATPWFWSQLGDNKLQIVGLKDSAETNKIKSNDKGFSVFYYKNSEVVCVESVNSAKDHVDARKSISFYKNET